MKKSLAIRDEDLKIIHQILSQNLPSSAVVWVFGSRAKGNPKPFSDLDLLIDNNQPLSSDIMVTLATAFEESELPYKVDILDQATVSELFLNMIAATKKRLR